MSDLKFTKMHGCGNDFIVIDCMSQEPARLEHLAKRLCHRRFGVGADQFLTVHPSPVADFRMGIYNADGGQVEMCGNGIRCFAKYVVDRGMTKKTELKIETLAGIIRTRLTGNQVEVDMGEPILEGRKIPADSDGKVLDHRLKVDGKVYRVGCVSMGNPHCVLYVEDLQNLDLQKMGPSFEHHSFFPNRVNTEFVKILGPGEVRMRVWERGAGETWACGTGACAVAVVGALTQRTQRQVTVHLLGGDLSIDWRPDDRVYMTGGADEVFQGTASL